jgi:hypothetical protein
MGGSDALRAFAALVLVTVSRPGAAFAPPSLAGCATGAGPGPMRSPALQARPPFDGLKMRRTARDRQCAAAVQCKAGGGRDESNKEEARDVGRGDPRNVSTGAQRSSSEPRFSWGQLDIDSEKVDVMMIKNDIGE